MASEARDLQWLNSLPINGAIRELTKCCGSRRWAEQLATQRPFEQLEDLIARANDVWWSLEGDDWLEAFRAHPRIGEKKAENAGSAQAQQWSSEEQAGVKDSAQDTIAKLGVLNREYEAKFGYIFIVCASGKSTDEMLALLESRLVNDPSKELPVAATEQAKITELRLKKLLA